MRWSPDSIELGPSAQDLIDELSVAGIGPVRRLSDGRWGWLPVVLDGRRPGRTSIGWPLIPVKVSILISATNCSPLSQGRLRRSWA